MTCWRLGKALAALAAVLLVGGCFSSVPRSAPPTAATQPPAPGTTATVFADPSLVQRYQDTITPEDLRAHLYFFASDYFEGRETATRGQKLAAYYLASAYHKMGLQPKGTAPTDNPLEAYFQPFTVYGRQLEEARLEVRRDGETVATEVFTPSAKSGEAYLSFGNTPEATGGLVFAGYGIADDELGYNDYVVLQTQNIDLAGQWMLILRDEPLADDSTSLLPTPDGGASSWTLQPYQKVRPAYQAGVAGILIVSDVGPRTEEPVSDRVPKVAAAQSQVASMSLTPGGSEASYPPIYAVSRALANTMLAPSGRTVEALAETINSTRQPVVFDVPQTTIQSTVRYDEAALTTENVLAFVEGSDPLLKNEVVILSSHYDHIGLSPLAEGDQINNGADDDGSGTVSILEMAEAFMAAQRDGHGPRRSILFLNVSGEEKGLLGSSYYADTEPVLPLEQTVTNLNIDMIGRYDPTHEGDSNYVYIIGSKIISKDLDSINTQVNRVTDLNLTLDDRFNTKDDPNQFYRRSDHWNFGKHRIPFIFYFTGTHEDYHQPGDEPDKIDYDRLARISRLIFGTAWQVANQDESPTVSGEGFN